MAKKDIDEPDKVRPPQRGNDERKIGQKKPFLRERQLQLFLACFQRYFFEDSVLCIVCINRAKNSLPTTATNVGPCWKQFTKRTLSL